MSQIKHQALILIFAISLAACNETGKPPSQEKATAPPGGPPTVQHQEVPQTPQQSRNTFWSGMKDTVLSTLKWGPSTTIEENPSEDRPKTLMSASEIYTILRKKSESESKQSIKASATTPSLPDAPVSSPPPVHQQVSARIIPPSGHSDHLMVDMPEICRVHPIPKKAMAEYTKDPLYGPVAEAFVEQVKRLNDSHSPFGEDFHEYEPIEDAGFGDSRIDQFDKNEKEIIHAQHSYPHDPDLYKKVYNLGTKSSAIDHDVIGKRVSGFLFAGFGRAPDEYEKDCGAWSQLLGPDRSNRFYQANKAHREFQTLFEVSRGKDFEHEKNISAAWLQTNLGSVSQHQEQQTGSIFISTTRSINVARYFSLSNDRKEGFIFVFWVPDGIDLRTNPGWQKEEQEVSVTGIIPWSHFVGYRKIARSASSDSPPEFVGPIYFRSHFQEKEPEAFNKLHLQLSLKSLDTRKHLKKLHALGRLPSSTANRRKNPVKKPTPELRAPKP